ncbi:MAG: helix-hairpin-helix domain-containing protein, partial [Geminicoccaceae bacterium]
VEFDELASIQGFDEDIAQALRERAEAFIAQRDEALQNEAAEAGIQDDLLGFEAEALTFEAKLALAKQGVKSLDDLADLAGDELVEFLPDAGLNEESAGELIMAARAHWFDDDEEEEPSSSDVEEEKTIIKAKNVDGLEGERPVPLHEPIGEADDLKQISGVGPKLEEMLNELGIYHYSQIAAFTPENIAWVDGYLSFKGRIERDEWLNQAGTLMTKSSRER